MISLLLELLALVGPLPFLFGQIRLDELFFELGVRRTPGSEAAIRKFTEGIRQTGTATKSADSSLKSFRLTSAATTTTAGGLNRVIGRLAVLFGGLFIIRRVVGAMTQFQTTMAEVATIAGGGAEQIEELTRATLALSRSVPQSAAELGAGAYQILSSGVKDTADIISILDASTRAATAGLTSTEVAVDAVTTVLNSFQLQASEANRVTDVLFRTVEDGKLRFETIAATIGTAATSAFLAGVEFEELAAGMAVLTQRGFDAAVATTSLNRLFLTATSKSKEQEEAFAKLGIEFTTTAIKADGFAVVLDRVREATGGDIDALSELFTEQRASRAAFILAGAGADDFATALDRARNSAGSAEAAFEIMSQTAANQGAILRNNVISTFNEIGLSILPTVSKAFAFLSKGIGAFVGGIKILGVEAAVVQQRLKVLAASVAAEFFAGFGDALEAADGFIRDINERLQGLADVPIFRLVVPLQLAAKAGETLVARLDEAAEADQTLAEGAAERLLIEQANLAQIEKQAEKEKELIVLEQEFARSADARAAATSSAAAADAAAQQLSEEALKRRAELTEQVLDEVAELTRTAVELQIIQFEKLEEAVKKEFQDDIPADVRAGLDRIAAELDSAKVIEAAEMLGEEIAERISAGLEAIEIDVAVADLGDEDERRVELLERQTAFLKSQETSLRAQLRDIRLESAEREVIRRRLAQVLGLLKKAGDEQEDITDEVTKEAEARANAIAAQLSLIAQAASGAADLAAEFGLVDDNVKSVIDDMIQLGTSIVSVVLEVQKLAQGIGSLSGLLAGGLGAIGAIAGIAGQIFGGGPSPEAVERLRVLEENTKRLKELQGSVEELRGTFELTGAQVARAVQQLSGTVETEILSFAETIAALEAAGGIQAGLIPELVAGFTVRLRELGVDLQNLDKVAEEFGITLRDEAGNVIPSALVLLIEALDAVEGSLIGFAQTIEGVFSRLRAEFEIFDITDPIEQFQRLQELLLQLAKPGANLTPFLQELLNFDISTAEGRAAADQLIRDLFRALSEGTLTPEELGAATFDEAVQILLEMEGLLDEINEQDEDALDDQEGATQDIRRSVQITELQANQLLAFQSTLVVRAEQRNIILAEIRDLLAGVGGVAGRDLGEVIPPIPIPDDGLIDARRIGPPTPVEQLVDIQIEIGDLVVVEG